MRFTRKTANFEALAEMVDCAPVDLPRLLSKLPDGPAWNRRRQALRLYYSLGMTMREIGGQLETTPPNVRFMLMEAIHGLRRVRDGAIGLTRRAERILGSDPTAWTKSFVLGLDCRSVLGRPRIGVKTLRVVRDVVASRGLRMACGCPDAPCPVARRAGIPGPFEAQQSVE